jgi:hypothetical protein
LPHAQKLVRYLRGARKSRTGTAISAIIIPGTMKDKPQLYSTNAPAISDPSILPIDVCEFHKPITKPRLQQQTENIIMSPNNVALKPIDTKQKKLH